MDVATTGPGVGVDVQTGKPVAVRVGVGVEVQTGKPVAVRVGVGVEVQTGKPVAVRVAVRVGGVVVPVGVLPEQATRVTSSRNMPAVPPSPSLKTLK